MIIKTEIEYLPTPKDFAEHMWESLDAEEMADVLYYLSVIREKQTFDFDSHMRYSAEAVAYMETDTYRKCYDKTILEMLKRFVEMIEEEINDR